jgi:hypothetical protein
VKQSYISAIPIFNIDSWTYYCTSLSADKFFNFTCSSSAVVPVHISKVDLLPPKVNFRGFPT